MSPSPEFYQEHTKHIGVKGFKEKADPKLLDWQKAQIPKREYDFVVQANINGKQLWGILGPSSTIYGEGHIVFPTHTDGYDFDLPGLAWMIQENVKTVGKGDAVAMYESIGLKFAEKYGEWKASTASSGFHGVGFALSFNRFTSSAEEWREMDNLPGKPQENAKLAVSAMGMAQTLHRDIPSMTIIPIPNVNMLNGQAPHAPGAIAA